MPSLHVVGLPENEAAQTAWARALKLWVVETLLQSQVSGQDLSERLVYRQLAARLQAELGLTEPPAPDVAPLIQALRDRRAYPLWSLWQARRDPDAPEQTRLLEAEVAVLLDLLQDQVGREKLFQLLPALREARLQDALSTAYQLDRFDFTATWFNRLSALSGVDVTLDIPQTTLHLAGPAGRPTERPPAPPLPPVTPGKHIAFICDGQIWIDGLEGNNSETLRCILGPCSDFSWSPDGRQLLAMNSKAYGAAMETTAIDENKRTRTDEVKNWAYDTPPMLIQSISWSPDGRETIHSGQSRVITDVSISTSWAFDVETGQNYWLKGTPLWSPNGENLIYAESLGEQVIAIWLADTNSAIVRQKSESATHEWVKEWENARLLTERASLAHGPGVWSPDGDRLALALAGDEPDESASAIYDLPGEHLAPLVTLADLRANLTLDGGFAAASPLPDQALYGGLWPLDWSADGRRLLVSARWIDPDQGGADVSALAVVALDDPTPQILASGGWGYFAGATWSPTHPDRLTFTWVDQSIPFDTANSFLYDLEAGSLYSAASADAAWSPDGAWVAFSTAEGVVIVDQDGYERFTLGPGGPCTDVAWNPVTETSTRPLDE